ncbi:MAG: choice-of-anchor Q domain-containing protein, partial [Pirellulales bacterium]
MRARCLGGKWRNKRLGGCTVERAGRKRLGFEPLEERRLLDAGGLGPEEPEYARLIYVDADARGAGSGASWTDAFNRLQDALATATESTEIRVAEGTYHPADAGGSRQASFQLKAGVDVRGGYAGFGQAAPDARNIDLYQTILSGDLAGNDGPNFSGRDDNSIHVVTSLDWPAAPVLEGFTIRGGYAYGSGTESIGGGAYCTSNASFIACTFVDNLAVEGGGIFCGPTTAVTSPDLIGCTFAENMATGDGGAIHIGDSDVTLVDCDIRGNSAGQFGGGLMFGNDNVSTLVNCVISGNHAYQDGGGLYGEFCFDWTMTNTAIVGNTAANRGGGMFNAYDTHMTVTNCILWDNTDTSGSGQSAQIINDPPSEIFLIENSCVQGWTGSLSGEDNFGDAPLFANAKGPDGHFGTADDNLRLRSGSPCVNAGNNTALPASVVADLDGNPRMVGGTVDVGPYEFQSQTVLYVDDTAHGTGNGASWANAFVNLQDALAAAADNSLVQEIRVAQGTYTPDRGAGRTLGDRTASFQPIDGIGILGGYAGAGATDPNARDTALYPSVLSGDLARNDGLGAASRGENSCHVVAGGRSIVLDGLTISGGNANGQRWYPESFGGGLYEVDGAVRNCVIRDNAAHTGAGLYQVSGTFEACVIAGNVAEARGGGAFIDGRSPDFLQCVFRDNVARPDGEDGRGGGMYTLDNSPDLFGCVFTGNVARTGGALVASENYSSAVTNCVFAGNRTTDDGAGLFDEGAGAPILTNCIFWDNAVNGTVNEAAQISGEAPTINFSCVAGLTGVLGGTGNLGSDPKFVDANGADNLYGTADDNLRLQPGSPCINAGNTAAVPASVLSDLDGNPRIASGAVDLGAYEFQSDPVIYVDDSATGAGNGANWANAFTSLQDALTVAAGRPAVREIRVAQGVYKPDHGARQTVGDRTATFQMLNGVTIRGGYAGAGAADPNARDADVYRTVLNGDLGDNDVAADLTAWGDNSRGENSYTVVTGSGTDRSAVLEGVTITGGHSNAPAWDDGTVPANFSFLAGGGMYNDLGSPTLVDVVFYRNAVCSSYGGVYFGRGTGGGAMYNLNSSPRLVGCLFEENAATGDNAGLAGGAIHNRNSQPVLDGCVFQHNVSYGYDADYYGGAVANIDSSPTLTNCLFTDNQTECGGAMWNYGQSNPTLVNCTLVANTNGIDSDGGSRATLVNSILWGNGRGGHNEGIAQIFGQAEVSYSCVMNWDPAQGGAGVITADPQFVDPGHWQDNGTPDEPWDDLWIDGDYRLRQTSPCVNAGNSAAVPAWVIVDLVGNPRILGGAVDLGAYESLGPRQIYVDDNAPADPAPGNPNVGDPLENGTEAHPFDAIQQAIDAAQAGDTVVVLDGRYTGNGNRDVAFRGKAITVCSKNGPENCVIDCQATMTDMHRGFMFHGRETAQSVLRGLTITNGAEGMGGGIYCDESSPTLENCVLSNNAVCYDGEGAGIYSAHGDPILRNCTFVGNVAGDSARGGGMANWDSDPILTDCRFLDNVTGWLGGGGLSNDYGSDPVLTRCTFIGNRAIPAFGHDAPGGAVANWQSEPTLVDCTFTRNSADRGGAIHDLDSTSRLTDCTFSGNFAKLGGAWVNSGQEAASVATHCSFLGNQASADGGAIFNSGATLTLVNCLLSGNASQHGGAIASNTAVQTLLNCTFSGNLAEHGGAMDVYDGSRVTLANSILWDNNSTEMASDSGNAFTLRNNCISGWSGPSGESLRQENDVDDVGTLDVDPRFVALGFWVESGDPANPNDNVWVPGDYHFRPGSPCINAGDNAAVPAGLIVDLDGQPRVVAGAVDMGVYECQHDLIVYVDDSVRGGVGNGTDWTNAFPSLQDALAALANRPFVREIWVAQGIYTPDFGTSQTGGDRTATFRLRDGIAIRGGYAGAGAADPNERDIARYASILTGDLSRNDGAGAANNVENCLHVVTGSGTNATAILDGFTITGGNANVGGYDNSAGGGMYNYSGSPTLLACTFTANYADWEGGGMMNWQNSAPTLINCVFSDNESNSGGGMFNRTGSDPTLVGCLFADNATPSYGGGGMTNYENSSPDLTNCTFVGNTALWAGPAIYDMNGATKATNCIFWGNNATQTNEVVPPLSTWAGAVTYSCFQDADPNDANVFPGVGNTDDDPRFVELYGADNTIGTGDENLRLLPGSPCINTGSNQAVPASLTTDLDGDPRIMGATVDMGAYEGPTQGLLLSTRSLVVGEGGMATFTIALAMDPGGTVQIQVARHAGDADIAVSGGGLLTFDSTNFTTPRTVTLSAAEDADRLNGVATIWVTGLGFTTAGITATEWDNDVSTIVYVDQSATGAGTGGSWTDAYTRLQDALGFAAVQPQVKEIHVAEGVYKPAAAGGPRTASFQLVDGGAVYGGFHTGGGDMSQRDPATHPTILSGDLSGNDAAVARTQDLLTEATRAENSYHVVVAAGCGEATVLDGFTVRGGNADAESNDAYGGGIRDGRLTLRDCVITANSARYSGGGVYSEGVIANCTILGNASANSAGGLAAYDSILTGCTISNNWAQYGGGGMTPGWSTVTDCLFEGNVAEFGGAISDDSSPTTLVRCEFRGNIASDSGGAIYTWEADPKLTDCTFIGNTAVYGGALSGGDGDHVITGCRFFGNTAEAGGGAIDNFGYNLPTFINCVFSGNSTEVSGGAVLNRQGSVPVVVNSTFSGNSAGQFGGGIASVENYSDQMPDNVKATNCVLWGNRDCGGTGETAQIYQDEGQSAVNYSCVQGWTGGMGGTGNQGADPRFVDANGSDDVFGTRDDNLRLLAGSPAINAGDNAAVLASVTTDLDGNPRIVATIVDMGDYEFQGPRTWYVDDNAPADPGPGTPATSDPLENGTTAHPFDAIQEAIDAAQNGDTVLVLDGRYAGHGNHDIDFLGKAITVRSANGAASTIVDASCPDHTHRGFSFHTGEGPGAILQGLTITNGYADNGGAISIVAASPRIEACVIQGNQAVNDGGGIYADGGAAVIANSTISGNRSDDGAGIAADRGASITVTGCTISGNDAADDGGGLYLRAGNAVVTLSNILGNKAEEGGGIRCSGGSPTITDSTIADNEAPYVGGGGIFLRSSDALIARCLFRNNGT